MQKGCVYFIKHNNFHPIKIGFTKSESPFERIANFLIAAPYGISVIGIIKCEKPQKIEKELHQFLDDKRLNGEWFDIDEHQAKDLIINYNGDLNLDSYDDSNYRLIMKISDEKMNMKEKQYAAIKLYTIGRCKNIANIAKTLNVSRVTVYRWLKLSSSFTYKIVK